MSTLYPDLTSSFPDSVDSFPTWLNIVAADGQLIQQYQSALQAGNTTLANQILAQIPQGTQKIIKASDLNLITSAMLAVERFYKDNIADYVSDKQESWLNTINQFSYKGAWSSGTAYLQNNIVLYTTSGLQLLFLATATPPLGTPPTNTSYWRVLTIQGQQGSSGPGLTYMQEWNASTTYDTNDAVTYGGGLWMALQPSTNVQPGTNDEFWKLVIPIITTTYPIQSTQPTAQSVGDLWFNTQENPTQYYYLETLDNPITQEMIPTGYQTYGADGAILNGSGPLPIASGGTDAVTSQNALANLGAGVRPNLLDNWYFVGGGSQQGGGQFPINQRGKTSYSGLGYAIDRWKIPGDGGTLTVNQNGITYQNTTENTAYLLELLELSSLIPGRQYTMSVLFAGGSASKATEFVCYRPGSPGYSVFTGNAVEGAGLSSVTFTVPEDTMSLEGRLIIGPYGMTGDFTAVAAKLELGDTQTLAYQDEDGAWQLFETPDYGEELAKCQRYYLPIDGIGRFPAVFSSSSTILQVFIPTPVTMRSIPTVLGITSLSARVYTGATNSQTLSVSEVLKTETGVLIIFSCSWPGSTSPAAYSNAVVVFGQRGALSAEL